MPHDTSLISTIVGALVLAFVFGAVAQRLRISPLVGYLLAGVAVGPFTPGFVADQHLALQLAEIGVILLMFGVGLHFSLKDLLSVKAIAVPGAVVQIAVATLLGMGLAWLMGWGVGGGLVFGLALSVASTVVLLRALQERRLIESEQGRIAVGWLIVEDLAMVLALVLLPAVADSLGGTSPGTGAAATFLDDADLLTTLAVTLGKVIAFVALMLVVGRRVIPWVMQWVAHTGSRELFRLAVLAIALGVAYGSALLFGVSFALGAFFAGMVLSESPLAHRAAEETLPLRDAFAVLFFVSVGMLVDPKIVIEHPLPLLGTIVVVLVGKSLAAYAIVRLFGHERITALTISASLAQIGEFSFILATLGVDLDLMPAMGRDLILAAAIVSIVTNPFFFIALDRFGPRLAGVRSAPAAATPTRQIPITAQAGHTVLVGYGRVGRLVGEGLKAAGVPLLVIEDADDAVEALRASDIEVVDANAALPEALAAANIAGARRLILAIPDGIEAGSVLKKARTLNPDIEIIARAHSDAEVEHLRRGGAEFIIMGEREVARGMLAHLVPEAAATGLSALSSTGLFDPPRGAIEAALEADESEAAAGSDAGGAPGDPPAAPSEKPRQEAVAGPPA
ncbi:YbaL family putative K(+) efflux transporter [Aquabacter spiritensis]|uniref:Kef-type potassium/proton antiporter (CPA2 family) n=1 Tax=Aquabacter spiritensis TaxID=933073 RepID=A0A4R3M5H9_9HYPH|nr:YbaL family putative K(+) efflux transporter [Aquabacter spiritensis]TCT08282.1 Kef-type potassium/proton antiporter (CPA2 family) [Aquabacter spiritensis]